MNITLTGYGKMGRMAETEAIAKGHRIGFIIDKDNVSDIQNLTRNNTDAVIEFTEPATAYNNVNDCLEKGLAVVCGTTGWNIPADDFRSICSRTGAAFLWSSNFNIGTHLFFMLNRIMAARSAGQKYKVNICETHHIHKKDKPSGTAVTLAQTIMEANPDFKSWKLTDTEENEEVIRIQSVREGEVTGIHHCSWMSETDSIELRHTAHNRRGFAAGAIMAAEFLQGKKGVYSMNDLLTEIIKL
jgi:4-hydroxy-tetrahydrodipicolinate reductase